MFLEHGCHDGMMSGKYAWKEAEDGKGLSQENSANRRVGLMLLGKATVWFHLRLCLMYDYFHIASIKYDKRSMMILCSPMEQEKKTSQDESRCVRTQF